MAVRVALLACCLSAANAFSTPAAAFLGAASPRFPRARAGAHMALNPPDIMPKVCAWFLCQSCASTSSVIMLTFLCAHSIPLAMRLDLVANHAWIHTSAAPSIRKPRPVHAGSEACDQWRRGTDSQDVGGSLQVSYCVCAPALCGYNKLVLTSISTDGLGFGVQGSGSGVW